MLEIRPTDIADLLIIATRWHQDERGAFSESYQQDRFQQAGIGATFMQDNHALSASAGTLRGLHFQTPPAAQSKLVRVLAGAIYDVAVDLRPGSKSYGHWAGVTLSAENRLQFFVPAGFAHGYLTLVDNSEVLYKVDAPYRPDLEGGLRWDDPELAIDWPLAGKAPIIAPRDQALPLIADLAPIEGWRS